MTGRVRSSERLSYSCRATKHLPLHPNELHMCVYSPPTHAESWQTELKLYLRGGFWFTDASLPKVAQWAWCCAAPSLCFWEIDSDLSLLAACHPSSPLIPFLVIAQSVLLIKKEVIGHLYASEQNLTSGKSVNAEPRVWGCHRGLWGLITGTLHKRITEKGVNKLHCFISSPH